MKRIVIIVTDCVKEASKPNPKGVSDQSTVSFSSGEQFLLGMILGAVPGWWLMLYTRQL